jgi:uncharacterized membrane protein YgdD (TMEM256/DUF423 family)
LVNLAFYLLMNKNIIITASIFGILAVIAGAFGAHGLSGSLTSTQLDVWHTAVQYQFYHTFALLFLSTFAQSKNKLISASYYFFTFGIIFFSGSLYLVACEGLLKLDLPRAIFIITPIGGLLFILGWLMLLMAGLKRSK